ncbi:MAG: hypothetical protein EAX95_04380 [Candidatus Thorarchaeota archaeon]|nr:hypothetical protein [Candidatus Thorarchaeota archaeon]
MFIQYGERNSKELFADACRYAAGTPLAALIDDSENIGFKPPLKPACFYQGFLTLSCPVSLPCGKICYKATAQKAFFSNTPPEDSGFP